jgi:hypothetical protein
MGKRKRGMTAAGEADIKAGVALDSALLEQAKRVGQIAAEAEPATAGKP